MERERRVRDVPPTATPGHEARGTDADAHACLQQLCRWLRVNPVQLLRTAEQMGQYAPSTFPELHHFIGAVCRRLEDTESELTGQPATVNTRNALQVLQACPSPLPSLILALIILPLVY